MKDVMGLFVVVLTSLMARAGGIEPNSGYCIGKQCFTMVQDPGDFPTAQKQCREHGGHLMTVRSSVSHDILVILLGNVTLRYWIGLRLTTGCPDAAAELKGFQWVTGDSESDFFNWAPSFNGSCASHRCVSVSKDDEFKWIQEPCGERAAGFLCEFSFSEPCQALAVARGESVTYRTPFEFGGEEMLSLPPGSTAIRMPAGTKYVCSSERWQRAPWGCHIQQGGCEHECEEDADHAPSCRCPPGQTVNPADNVTCDVVAEGPRRGDCTDQRRCPGENVRCVSAVGGFQCVCRDGYTMAGGQCVDVDECDDAPCEHLCENTAGSYACLCYPGYKEDPKSPNKCKLHCPQEECDAECDPNDRFQCYCPDGYVSEERDHGTVCIDIDECSSFSCDQHCQNTFGSYVCTCSPGYTLVDQYKCSKNEIGKNTSEGSATTPNIPTTAPAPYPDPTRRPSGVTVGGFVGIIVCTVFFIVLVVFLAHHVLNGRGKMGGAGALKAPEDEAHGLGQVTSDTC